MSDHVWNTRLIIHKVKLVTTQPHVPASLLLELECQEPQINNRKKTTTFPPSRIDLYRVTLTSRILREPDGFVYLFIGIPNLWPASAYVQVGAEGSVGRQHR